MYACRRTLTGCPQLCSPAQTATAAQQPHNHRSDSSGETHQTLHTRQVTGVRHNCQGQQRTHGAEPTLLGICRWPECQAQQLHWRELRASHGCHPLVGAGDCAKLAYILVSRPTYEMTQSAAAKHQALREFWDTLSVLQLKLAC